MNITKIRFTPGNCMFVFSDKSGDRTVNFLTNYEYGNTESGSYNKYKELYLAFPSLQMYDSETSVWNDSYVGSGVTYHLLLKIDGWQGYSYYKRFLARDLNNYISVASRGFSYYVIKLSDIIPQPLMGVNYSFKCYAQYNTGSKVLSTRPSSIDADSGLEVIDDSSDPVLSGPFYISNPKNPYLNSVYMDNSLINLDIHPSFEDSPNLSTNGRSREVYEIVVIPSNATDFSQASIEEYTRELMGADINRRLITRLSDSIDSPDINVTYSDNDPSAGPFIRGKKLLEYGTNEVYFGLNLYGTAPDSESKYIYNNYPESENSLWFKFKIDNKLEYKSYKFDVNYFFFENTNAELNNFISFNNNYIARPNSTITLDFSNGFNYIGTYNFELKLSWFDYTFKSSTPVFNIDLSSYYNRLIVNSELYMYLKVFEADTKTNVFSSARYLSSKNVYFYMRDDFHSSQNYSYEFSFYDSGDSTVSLYLKYNSNQLSYYSNTQVSNEKLYLARSLRITVVNNTDNNSSYTYDKSSATLDDFIKVSNIECVSGTNNFTLTIYDKILEETVYTNNNIVFNTSTTSASDNTPILSINKENRSICINENALNHSETFYVNGNVVINGGFYTDSSDNYLFNTYTIGENLGAVSLDLFRDVKKVYYDPSITLPTKNGTKLQPSYYVCRPLGTGNSVIHDLYYERSDLYHVRLLNTGLLFCIDPDGNDVRGNFYD